VALLEVSDVLCIGVDFVESDVDNEDMDIVWVVDVVVEVLSCSGLGQIGKCKKELVDEQDL
jgi:hypothetical protein